MLKDIIINENNASLIDVFLNKAGSALKTFRYFQKHPKSIIKNHLITYIITDNDAPVCYGHLDKENNTIWLGIAVAEGAQKKGLGTMMMEKLIDFAKEKNVQEISLSVDNDNPAAIKLYKRFGFALAQKNEKSSIYRLTIK